LSVGCASGALSETQSREPDNAAKPQVDCACGALSETQTRELANAPQAQSTDNRQRAVGAIHDNRQRAAGAITQRAGGAAT
jgi:hypothetical protein